MEKLQKEFAELVVKAFEREALKRLVFSRPTSDATQKISARLCAHRGRRVLAMEYSLPSGTVSQKNVGEAELLAELSALIPQYKQINLITLLGDAEYKLGKASPVILGKEKLLRKLAGDAPAFESAIEALDKCKKHILSGGEDFLIKLGISDKSGRVHDKKQGKFRQINKFLEYVDEVYPRLPQDDEICIFDLCCGKSYLSFAVYYFLTQIKKRRVNMLGIDLKRDVMDFCNATATELGFSGMKFIVDDVTNTPENMHPNMVISLHACDVATDIVLSVATRLRAEVILSTPCCHKHLSDHINSVELGFVTKYPKLKGKLCEAITDALRLERLEALGYEVSATELVDPEDTPKNTLLRATLTKEADEKKLQEYNEKLDFIFGNQKSKYLPGID